MELVEIRLCDQGSRHMRIISRYIHLTTLHSSSRREKHYLQTRSGPSKKDINAVSWYCLCTLANPFTKRKGKGRGKWSEKRHAGSRSLKEFEQEAKSFIRGEKVVTCSREDTRTPCSMLPLRFSHISLQYPQRAFGRSTMRIFSSTNSGKLLTNSGPRLQFSRRLMCSTNVG